MVKVQKAIKLVEEKKGTKVPENMVFEFWVFVTIFAGIIYTYVKSILFM